MAQTKARLRRSMKADLKKDIQEIRKASRSELSRVASRYLDCIICPADSAPCGVPTLIGGHPGVTKIQKTQITTDFVCGTSLGFIVFNPGMGTNDSGTLPHKFGGWDGNSIASRTTANYAGTLIASSGTAFVEPVLLTTDITPSANSVKLAEFSYRPVAAMIEVFPTSSVMDQNGTLVLAETAGHANANVSFSELSSDPRSRVISGVQFGSKKDRVILNWHPQTGAGDSPNDSYSDFSFMNAEVAETSTIGPLGGLIIAADAAPGTTFRCVLTLVYEYKGLTIRGGKPRLVDSRGMDLVTNIMARKARAGYVGDPAEMKLHYRTGILSNLNRSDSWLARNGGSVGKGLVQALSGDLLSAAKTAAGLFL